VLFGAYPYDVDKKAVMMNKVDEMYPNIDWIRNANGEIKKENYDACDSLVCALAYVNTNRHGVESPQIITSMITQEQNQNTVINYTMRMWGSDYEKILILSNL
jgi:short-subunit dehydrogenase involved in D-alanine esterification of teichoic acids